MRIRSLFFWLHLIAGVVAGLVILVMSATGVILAFEKKIIAWTERNVRRVMPSGPEAKRLSLDEMLALVRVAQPEARPTSLTIQSDPGVAVLVSLGRTNTMYVNPHTGAVQPQGANRTCAFIRTMIEWYR